MFTDLPYTTYITVLLLAFLSVFSTLLGVALAIYVVKSEQAIALGIGFSAGIMLLVSFFELVPEAVGDAGMGLALVAVVLGMLIVAALHWIIPHTHLVDEKGSFRPNLLRTAYLVAFGLILHDVPEGFAMANSYIASPSLGILMAIAIAIHNVPEEFAMAVPIVAVKKRRFLYTAAFLSGLAEPVGAIIGLVAVHFHPALNSFFMAFAAGAMIFVSIHELLPMARRYHKIHLFVLGSVISVFVYMLLTAVVPG
ncbi:ZIP family metal transporter [Solemya velum gill symbiont]|uniref:Zinc permease n=2 Tax=Solemya velum gill symbiont TaxID=2340 RepID=A0A1T2E474_SOVGS|nr:ZIP family metal transporter [Solemya velum gill symbiont]OOY35183.1 zinc permease [Solemya velum gill symbiont]OOY37801.1 zinc permease [Solemya velum gill symbiont]OOY41096.1 zinc permease [Solemya velum gill symbiont]OOY44702.1 zinc permease [Solemya velum gill symbiont]OOY46905.1 zinc permease [Solemya velum gill symbiont]